MLDLSAAVEPAGGAVAAEHRLAAGAAHAGQDAWLICGRFRGYSPGRRTGTCCRAGTASAAASRHFSTCARSAAWNCSSACSARRGCSGLILDDVERTLLQVDLSIAREYAGLIEDDAVREPIFARITEEYRLTCEMILRISGDGVIAERFPQFRRRLDAPPEDHQCREPRTSSPAARAPCGEQRRSAHRIADVDQLRRRRIWRDRLRMFS